MKVISIYYKYPLYENGSYIQEQVDGLASCVDKVILFAANSPAGAKFHRPENLEIIWVAASRIPFLGDLIFNLSIIYAALRSKSVREADIINVICARGIPAGIFIKKLIKKPLVVTVEIINEEGKSLKDRLFNNFQKFLYTRKSIDHIICWSHFHYDKYLKPWGVKKNQVSIIPGGINLSVFDYKISGEAIRKKYLGQAKKLIVFAKPMYEYNRKSAEFLLEAFALYSPKSEVKLLFGRGEQVEILKEKIKSLGLEVYCSFMDFVSLPEIPKYIAAADLIVLPFTYNATTARSLLEALAMKKPVIATDMGEIPRVVENGKDALLVSSETALAKAIAEVFADQKLAESLARSGYELVKKNYAIDKISARTAACLEEVIRTSRE